MIQSMTGFGKSISQIPNKKITVELKSLNSKNFDLNARIPSQYREKELELRTLISNSLGRGKVDLSIFVEYTGEQTSTNVNTEVVKAYMEQLKKTGRHQRCGIAENGRKNARCPENRARRDR